MNKRLKSATRKKCPLAPASREEGLHTLHRLLPKRGRSKRNTVRLLTLLRAHLCSWQKAQVHLADTEGWQFGVCIGIGRAHKPRV